MNPTLASLRAHADAESVVRRLLTTDATVRSLAAEYGCIPDTIHRVYRRATTRRQRMLARSRKLSAAKRAKPSGCIGPGCVPWNKGLSVLLSPGTVFKKGELRGTAAKRYCPVGTISVRKDPKSGKPSRWIKVNDTGPLADRWELYGRWWWLRNVGPVPAGHRVTHRDGDTMNDEPGNLACLSGAEFLRLMASLDPSIRGRQMTGWIKARRRRASAERESALILRARVAELLARAAAVGLRDSDLARRAGLTPNRVSQLRAGRARLRDPEWRSINAALSQIEAEAGPGAYPETREQKASTDVPRAAKDVARERVAAFLSQLNRAEAA